MKHSRYIWSLVLLMAGSLPAFSQVSNDNEDKVNKIDSRFSKNDFVSGQVLVKFKDENRIIVNRTRGKYSSTSANNINDLLRKYGADEMEQLLPRENPKRSLAKTRAYNGETIQEHDLSQLYCIKLSSSHVNETMQLVDELKTLNEVEFAEPNYRVYMMADTHIADDYSGNPMESQQWYLDAYGVKELWNKPIINKERPVIAILDTGVDMTHPDLKDNLWTNTAEEFGTKDNDNDGNGFKNDVHGWDFVNNTANIRDYNMHGTHVAGIAAAANNGIGIVGANPQALIMPITVLQSDGAGDMRTIIKGIDYAIANGASVINMSLGTYVNSHALRQALESAYQKAVLVAAAGNDGKCIYASHWPIPHKEPVPMPCFPAAYSFVLGIQATVNGGSMASYSNYDDDGPLYSCESSFFAPDGYNYELKVPGSQILSTIPGGKYKELNGTSMAAPLAAGAISALKMVKQYNSQEVLWGDLLHTENIAQAYDLTSRPAELDLVRLELRARKDFSELSEDDYSNDNEVDAGETVSLYPVIRTTFGTANNIKLKVMVDEFEDPDVVEIINGEADFGIRLDAYGKAVSLNPLTIKISNSIAEGRHIRLKMVATCDEMTKELEYPFTLVTHNMIKINGLINENTTLTSDHVYYVNGNLGINKGVTLTIEPGTRLEFAGGTILVAFGKLNAKGTPDHPIVFARHAGEDMWNGIYGHEPEGEHKHGGVYTNNEKTLFTLLPTESTPNPIYEIWQTLYYQPQGEVPSKSFHLYDYMGREGWLGYKPNFTGKEHLFKDPSYLTPAITKMFDDFSAYCNLFSLVETGTYTESTSISVDFFTQFGSSWVTYDNDRDTLLYCRIEDCNFSTKESSLPIMAMYDCVLEHCIGYGSGARNLIMDGSVSIEDPNPAFGHYYMKHNNIINSRFSITRYSWLYEDNVFNNNVAIGIGIESSTPVVDRAALPSYLGTSREDFIRPYINSDNTWGTIDLSNMRKEPVKESHGIVWKILVNGKDAQDEFEDMIPLGVGKHKFEVLFSRPMNKIAIPQVSFGIREPYNQQSVSEDGSWNEEGTIYTVYKTITGKTMSDGLNRIYVNGAEDDEYFPCPYEKNRFNVVVQAAGSMATGFSAEEGMGCIKLKWNKSSIQQENALGYNVYRYHQIKIPSGWRDGSWHDEELDNDTVRLNQDILDLKTTALTDYDVTPGVTYYYYYNLLGTDLQAFDMSNVVAATPMTATLGDANGSGAVDIADVITTVNYVTRQDPKPFIFEAADVNEDQVIDILDVIGIVKGILDPTIFASAAIEGMATYTIEDGVLYIDSPVSLGGIQVQLTVDDSQALYTLDALEGFEQASTWLSNDDYLFLAYSMNGKTLNPGKHAILQLGDSEIVSLRLSDVNGNNVAYSLDNGENTTGIETFGRNVMKGKGVYDLQGRKVSVSEDSKTLRHGVYIIDGKKVVK